MTAGPDRSSEAGVKGSHVSEWFGYRVFPSVAHEPSALQDQRSRRCPFLSRALGGQTQCVKPAGSLGICTISSTSNGPRQDWLVCPYRALDENLTHDAVRRLFRIPDQQPLLLLPAPTLAAEEVRAQIADAIRAASAVVIYLQDKLGGEVSIPPTERSPELAFDVTLVEVLDSEGDLAFGRYGILEIQTMDFHGSYRAVVTNLQDALRLHGDRFHESLMQNPQWLSQRIEGPNIANVFKRTFYQMVLKFQIGADESCAGCVLALPSSVWDSWQRHLGRPELVPEPDGTFTLRMPGREITPSGSAWIYVFEVDGRADVSPNPVSVRRIIATDADSMSYYALKLAPSVAVAGVGSSDRVLGYIRRRVGQWWPELGRRPVHLPPGL